MKLPPLPELPNDLDWEAVKKLGDECDEAMALIYGPEVAAMMRVAATLLRGMPKMMEEYALAYGRAVQKECAKVCDGVERKADGDDGYSAAFWANERASAIRSTE